MYSVVVSNLVNRTLLYDNNGNLTNDGSRGYVYDGANRVTQITQGTNSVSFSYDGFGRRKQIVQNGSTNLFLWCATEICEQRDAAGGTTQKQFFPQGVRDGGTNYFYARDHLGSVREITDGSQVLVARYDYDPYGRRTKLSGSYDADFGFTGHYTLKPAWMADEVVPTLHRIYLPNLGRWGSRDPISDPAMAMVPSPFINLAQQVYDGRRGSGQPGMAEFGPDGPNLYSYVHNDPLNYLDPNGAFGVQFGGFNFGFGNPNYAFSTNPLGDIYDDYADPNSMSLGGAAAATADGFVPFYDPFGSDFYDPCDEAAQMSQFFGGVSRDALLAAGGLRAGGIGSNVGLHGPHHTFGSLGRLSHIQINVWRTGVPGSGSVLRIPLPW